MFSPQQNSPLKRSLCPHSPPKKCRFVEEKGVIEWNTKKFIIFSEEEEKYFKQIYLWRPKFNEPVLRVKSLSVQQKRSYPKILLLDVQKINDNVAEMKNLDLIESLYILRESLLGVQALTKRFHDIQLNRISFGINNVGECRTWIDDNKKVTLKFSSHNNLNISAIFNELIQSIFTKTKNCYKPFIQKLYEYVVSEDMKFFSSIQQSMKAYIAERKINIGKVIKHRNIISTKTFMMKKSLSKKKNYMNSTNQIFFNDQLEKSKDKVRSFKNFKNQISSMKNLQKVQNSYEICKLESSETFGSSNSLKNNERTQKSGFSNGKTTYMTDNIKTSKDEMPFELLPSYRQTCSLLMENKVDDIKTKINLGNLDPVPEDQVKNSNSGQSPQSEESSIPSLPQSERIQEEAERHAQSSQNFWKGKIQDIFSNTKPLKQSIHCGEQKKITSFCTSELAHLGKMGRDIKYSICQADNNPRL